MSTLNDTPNAERVHIGFFGCRNAGKSSLVNRVTNQRLSVVSDVAGTTTDLVTKAMELLPLGPVLILDTPGYDDSGALGEKRVEKTKEALRRCDAAVLVTDCTRDLNATEKELIALFSQLETPYVVAHNKCDLLSDTRQKDALYVSAATGEGVEELKNRLARLAGVQKSAPLLSDLIDPGDFVVLVTPIDAAAPKGRMILPQQMAIREVLDCGGMDIVTQPAELPKVLENLRVPPRLVVTDSQAFETVKQIVPDTVALTSFSILMARKKGFLKTALSGAAAIDRLQDGDMVLISEGCTHHRQCGDIGSVKLPAWLQKRTGKDLKIELSNGRSFPSDLAKYALVIHCGGCMLNEKEMRWRMRTAVDAGTAFTNYGTAIAYMQGILPRATAVLPEGEVLRPKSE